jgi:plasmid stabilization system protein ParE
MALKISWSKKALLRFNEITSYLESEFGRNTASGFVNKVYESIFIISIFPEIGSIEKEELNIRGLIIFQQVTLFYQVRTERIILLNFYDNRQNPKRLKF